MSENVENFKQEKYVITMRDGVQHNVTGFLDTNSERVLVTTDKAWNFWAPTSEVSSVVRVTEQQTIFTGAEVGTLKIDVDSIHKGKGCRCV